MDIRVFERKRRTAPAETQAEAKCENKCEEICQETKTAETKAVEPKVTMPKSMYDALVKQNAELKEALDEVKAKSAARIAALNQLEAAVKQAEQDQAKRIKELSEEVVKWKNAYSTLNTKVNTPCTCKGEAAANKATEKDRIGNLLQPFVEEFHHNHPDYDVTFTFEGDITKDDLMEYFEQADMMATRLENEKKSNAKYELTEEHIDKIATNIAKALGLIR